MSHSDKGENITLVNSKCSESTVDSHSQLYRAVVKNLKDNTCQQHQEKYEYFYNYRLMCPECFSGAISIKNPTGSPVSKKKYEYFYHLETILNHPMILVIDESELISHPLELMELVLNSYKQLYPKKSDFKLQKQCIESFISRLKGRIDQLCNEILTNFTQMQQNLTRQSDLKDDLKNLSMMYEDHLMEMLGDNFTEGSKSELEKILAQYGNSNESPFSKIMSNLDELMAAVSTSPVIDLERLENIYITVTDERLWKPLSTISAFGEEHCSHLTADMLMGTDQLTLQGSYTLQVNETEAVLLFNAQIIGKLQIQIDSLYSLDKYRLLGVNYDKLMVINYFDQLIIEDEYPLPGCTDVLPFKDHLIVISNDELVKIDRGTKKYEILGRQYKNLRYNSQGFGFSCSNNDNENVIWKAETQYWPSARIN